MDNFAIFVQKVLISETVRDRAKPTKIWDHMHHKLDDQILKILKFLKMADFAILVQKVLISET